MSTGLAPSTNVDWRIRSIGLHNTTSKLIGSTFTVDIDSGTTTLFDIRLLSQAMASVKNYSNQYETPYRLAANDVLKFAWPQGSTHAKWGLEVVFQRD